MRDQYEAMIMAYKDSRDDAVPNEAYMSYTEQREYDNENVTLEFDDSDIPF